MFLDVNNHSLRKREKGNIYSSRKGKNQVTSVSTIGGGGDTTISSPRRSPKQPLPRIGLHDPLHGPQACLEFNSFH